MSIATPMLSSASASKSLQQLSSHSAHKVLTSPEEAGAEGPVPFGVSRMEKCKCCLTIFCETDEGPKMDRLKGVTDNHLERFAWREELKFSWRRED